MQSVEYNNEKSDVQVAGVTSDDELDRAGLKSAFRFAAWSSLILVSAPLVDASSERRSTSPKLYASDETEY